VIVSAGPWLSEFIQSVPPGLFKVYRQVLYWFGVSTSHSRYAVGKFPIFIWSFGRWRDDYVYGFPAVDGTNGGLKVASESYELATSPDVVDREVPIVESSKMFDTYVNGKLRGVDGHCVKSAVCLYTVTPNSNFVIDRLDENVILASPCSGHGFKHSAAIGETLAEMALTGRSTIDIAPFSMDQFSE
jgi:sarcosine oxidase